VQPGRFANLAQRQARLSRMLKGFPASDASLIALSVNAGELRLSALDLGACLVLGVLCHAGQPIHREVGGRGRLGTLLLAEKWHGETLRT
jgi:hypothetical protein